MQTQQSGTKQQIYAWKGNWLVATRQTVDKIKYPKCRQQKRNQAKHNGQLN